MHKFQKCLLILIFLSFSCSNLSFQLDKNKLDNIINKYVSENYYPFLHVLIDDKNGQTIYEYSSVNKTAHPELKVDKNTLMRIWSMSKIVTISIVMDLVEEKLISLDDAVIDYIPEFKSLDVAQSPDGRSLSIFTSGSIFESPIENNVDLACPMELKKSDSIMLVRHLVDHTAGFYYANTGIECLDKLIIDEDPVMADNSDSLINILSRLPLVHHPGERYHYGLNTTVLGLVAERATNMSLEELVADRITKPSGFDGLKFKLNDNEKLIPAMTYKDGYFRNPKKGEMDISGNNVPMYDKDQQLYLGGGGLVSTSKAYANYLRIWLNNGRYGKYQFLNPSTITDMMTSVRKKSGHGTDTQFFFFITGDSVLAQGRGDVGLWEGGGYEGTTFWVDQKRGFSVVIMTQVWWPKDGAYNFRDEFRGELYRQIFEYENTK